MSPTDAGTQHGQSVTEAIGALFGQWIEAVDSTPDGLALGLVTSRGWILRGALSVPGFGAVQPDDSRLVGLAVLSVEITTAGSFVLQCARLDEKQTVNIEVACPWALVGEEGLAVAARPDGAVGLRKRQGPTYATPETMQSLITSAPSDIEMELLRRADDDWISPADANDILLGHGIESPDERTEQGIAAFANLIGRGELQLGVIGDEGFDPSTAGLETDIELLARTWRALSPRDLNPGQIGWFTMTDAGRSRLAGDLQ